MYKKKKKNTKKLIIPIVIIISISLLILSILLYNHNNTIFKDIGITLEKIIIYPFTSLNKEKDKNQTESYTIQKNVNASLEKEIKELKDALELNKTLTEYEIINATVLSRNKSYWFNTITIDKGTNDGIKINMAVITKNGLIGKISKVSKTSSEVKLITSNDSKYKVSVSIKVNDTDNYGILAGYDSKNNLIKISDFDKGANIKEGDAVLTSGLGELFPTGIYVGTVKKIKSDKYNLSKTAYIVTKQDFNDIHYVTVLKVKQ